MRGFILMLVMVLGSYANPKQDEMARALLSEMPGNGLSKTMAPTATSYISSYFNVMYICPTGWTITYFDSSLTGFSLTVTKSLRTNIHIYGKKFLTSKEARYFNNWSCFGTSKIAYDASSKMPGIYGIWDTTYASGITSVGINLKYAMDANMVYQSQCSNASESFSIYEHEYWYFTTTGDYTANGAEYSLHWKNLTFNTTASKQQVLSKESSNQLFVISNNILTLSRDQQKGLKLDLYDVLGKQVSHLYDFGMPSNINLNKGIPTSNYLLRATTSDGSEYYKVFIK